MKTELIKEKDIVFFFNKYKYNSDQIFHLERRLLNESYSFEKWQKMLDANSDLTREHFAENQSLIEEYIYPILENPQNLSNDICHALILHVTFFLFENNIDSLIAEDIISALLNKRRNLDINDKFDASLCLAIYKTLMAKNTFDELSVYFKNVYKIFKSPEEIKDVNIKLHLIFCKIYEMLSYDLYNHNDFEGFISIYKDVEFLIKNGDVSLYKVMWANADNYEEHINVLLRILKIYGMYLCVSGDFSNEIINEWIINEYTQECSEGSVNLLIYFLYYKYQYVLNNISKENYIEVLEKEEKNFVRKNEFSYPESAFPIDDIIPSCKAELFETMKLFNNSFICANILIPELFKLKDGLVDEKKQLIKDFLGYYKNSKYAEKGFQTDSFILRNIKLFSEVFDDVSEYISLIQTLVVYREIASSIHFVMVGNMAGICLSYLIEKYPEYFTTPLYKTGNQVLEHKGELLKFIKEAGYIHDIGKLGYTNFVNLHYRKITDKEYFSLKNHVETGFNIVKNIPYLQNFSEIVLNHHKYFDGKGGYPENNNDSYSYKGFLDIISICDTLDTSTDFKGRNYAAKKSFDDIVLEMKNLKGRYNSDFVNLISEDFILQDELRYMVSGGRTHVSFEIYQKYIEPNISFCEADEKTVCEYSNDLFNQLIEFYCKNKYISEEQGSHYIYDLLQKSNLKVFILKDIKNNIYGFLAGVKDKVIINDFFITDFIIDSDYRNQGWGTELLLSVQDKLKKLSVNSLSLLKPQKTIEGFFWIKGFENKEDLMIKKI